MLSATAFQCTSNGILVDLPLQIWDAHTTLSVAGVPTLVFRALHNKLVYYFTNYTQCYVHYLSPRWFIYQFGLPLTLLLIVFLFFLHKKSPAKFKRLILLSIAVYPIIMTFELYKYVV